MKEVIPALSDEEVTQMFHDELEGKLGDDDEAVDCHMCGNMMWYSEDDGIYVCINQECTRCIEK